MTRSSLRNGFLITVGVMSVFLGALGVVLPLLPTTPFLLLATICFVRSSPSLNRRLLNAPILGNYIRDYREGRGIPWSTKVATLIMLWLSISFSAFRFLEHWGLRALLIGIAVAVTVHILRMPTAQGQQSLVRK